MSRVGGNSSAALSPAQPKQIHLSAKTGIPLNVLPKKGLTAKQLERMQMINSSDLPKVSTQPRPKNESKEDKRARKQAIKEERKVTAPSDVGLAKRCWGDRVHLYKCNLGSSCTGTKN